MRKLPVTIKTGGTVVATIEVDQFESLQEASDTIGGEHEVLALVNRQYKADVSNAERVKGKDTTTEREGLKLLRAAASGKLSKADLAREIAKLLGDDASDGTDATPAE